ncbi:MAG: MoaD/ThiS family protein, partial [Desulfurivibrionaceae bacterium]
RELAGTKEGHVQVDEKATWRDVIRQLALQYPALPGVVISPDHTSLAPSYMLNVGGRAMVRDLDLPAQAGERVLLMFAEAGG